MKRMLIFGLALILVLSIFGCEKPNTNVVTSQPAQTTGGDDTGTDTTGTDTSGTDTGTTTTTTTIEGIDLNLEKVSWSTIYPVIGSTVELKLTVKNTGNEAIDGFDYNIRITKDGTEWKDETKTYGNKLYPSNKTKIIEKYTFTSAGEYKAEIYLDKDNKLGERNRFNNVQISSKTTAMQETSTPSGSDDDSSSDSGSSSDTGSSGDCVDTDNGKDESTKGECNDGDTVGISDFCSGDATAVIEWYCDDNDICQTEEISCENSCEEGACN